MAGLALLSLAVFYWLIDVAGYKRWATVFVIFGMNAIAIYFLSEILDTSLRFVLWHTARSTITLRSYLFRSIFAPLASPEGASLLFALSYVFLMFLIAWAMWRMRIFIRV
jgi:predicted acyltransferase